MISLIVIAVAFWIAFFILDLIRREKLTFRYAFPWLSISVLAVVFALKQEFIFQLAYAIGFELPSNFIFFTVLGVFVVLSLWLTIFLCQQHKRNDIMAQKIAILETALKNMQQQKKDDVV